MITLPIDSLYADFIDALKDHHLVVESDTGSGKSTRLPIWCTEAIDGRKSKRVLVIEPRRVACLALSGFITSTLKNTKGTCSLKVGHAIRFDSTVTPETDIAFVTPGVALRWLSSNQGEESGLKNFDVVMIDEFHERRWDTDLLLAILKHKALDNPRLRLVLTSATIDGERLTAYLDSKEPHSIERASIDGNSKISTPVGCKRLIKKGSIFHVELLYQAKEGHHLPDPHGLEQAVKQAVIRVLKTVNKDIATGSMLIFLPGRREISQCQQVLASLCETQGICCLALHGGIDVEQQKQVLEITDHQRIILATNVAETSLTIPNITSVIDSGLERRTHQRNGSTVLSLTRISKASADQRKGRAGRIANGICIRLWGQYAPLEALTPPELQREELVEPMLAAACFGVSIEHLDFIDVIPAKSLAKAKQHLILMGAIGDNGLATKHGKRLFPLPLDTQFAHLISAMPDMDTQTLMIDLAAALSLPKSLFTPPVSEWDLKSLIQWEPLACDATTLVKLVREPIPEYLNIDNQLRKEARQLSNQIREALTLPLLANMTEVTVLEGQSWICLRHRWLSAVIKALPELAFIRRQKRIQALGNGFSEVQIARDSRFDEIEQQSPHHTEPKAAVVFDQFSTSGKGSKQTLDLATCMAPIKINLLVEANLGEEQLVDAQQMATKAVANGQVKIERYFAGQVIDTRFERASADQALDAIVSGIMAGKIMPGLGKSLTDDLQAWDIWISLGMHKQADMPFSPNHPLEYRNYTCEEYLQQQLEQLGVEDYDDLELIGVEDLIFDAIPDWQRAEFDQKFPRSVSLPELKMVVEYYPPRKGIILCHLSGSRKTGPKRWELPSWKGWKIQYRKASKVVDVK